jgi:hypothetical protein
MPGARHDILGKPVYPLFVPPVGRDLYRYVGFATEISRLARR